jgi:hypothetical protein
MSSELFDEERYSEDHRRRLRGRQGPLRRFWLERGDSEGGGPPRSQLIRRVGSPTVPRGNITEM